jgi:hypothetical protein
VIYVATQAWKELLRFYSFVVLMAMCAGIFLYDVNRAHSCYYRDTCPTAFATTENDGLFQQGEHVLIVGQTLSTPNIYNAMYGVWFAVVTMNSVGYGDIEPVVWPEYLIAIALMLLGAFLMAIPLSVISRHFNASYELLEQKQAIRGRALHNFARQNRKSSAFVIKDLIGRRMSGAFGKSSSNLASVRPEHRGASQSLGQFASSSSLSPSSSQSSLGRINKNLSGSHDSNDGPGGGRDSIVDMSPTMTKAEEAQKNLIGRFKKEIEMNASAKLNKTLSDGRALVSDYQLFAKQVLSNVHTLSASMLDKESRKNVRKTIKQTMHAGGAGGAAGARSTIGGHTDDAALQRLREKHYNGTSGGKGGSGSKKGGSNAAFVPKNRGSTILNSISEKDDSDVDEDDEEKRRRRKGDDEDDEENEDSEEDSDDDDDDDDDEDSEDNDSNESKDLGDVDDDDFDLPQHKKPAQRGLPIERRQSTLRTDINITSVVTGITTQLLDLIDKLIRMHVPHGADLRDLLELHADFDVDANALLETFKQHFEEEEEEDEAEDSHNHASNGHTHDHRHAGNTDHSGNNAHSNSTGSLEDSVKGHQRREAEMLERAASATWSANDADNFMMSRWSRNVVKWSDDINNTNSKSSSSGGAARKINDKSSGSNNTKNKFVGNVGGVKTRFSIVAGAGPDQKKR